MPKELRVDRPLRDRSTIDRHIGSMLAEAILVDDLGERLLPDAALPTHEDADIGRSDEESHLDSPIERRAVADDLLPLLGATDLLLGYTIIHIGSLFVKSKGTQNSGLTKSQTTATSAAPAADPARYFAHNGPADPAR